nr:DNA topoisomerase 2-alpha-like isoform X1 [Dermatophagoides farinae]
MLVNCSFCLQRRQLFLQTKYSYQFVCRNIAQGSSPPVKKSRIDEPCQIEHILFRPNIGSVEKVTKQMWVYASQDGMVLRDVSYVPQLYKIFDEILVNIADDKICDQKMTIIKIEINMESDEIIFLTMAVEERF